MSATGEAGASRQLFGHPVGLAFLFGTEMWERFSYYGMRTLLVLYMVKYLLAGDAASGVLGLATLRAGLEAISGPLGAQPFASQIYGLYGGLVYLTPILGGMIADRWLGRRRTVVAGATLMMIGHFMMTSERLFLLALTFLILGNGAFKPNIVTQVGGLYKADDARRDRAYSIFYVGINVGAFFSPLVCGTLGERAGWHYGFAAAGVGMAIGLVTYLAGLSRLPPDVPRQAPADAANTHAREPGFAAALAGVVVLFVPSALFWAAYEQQGNTVTLWTEQAADRTLDLLVWKGEIPVTWFLAFNPLMIFLFTPLLTAYWARRATSGREPATILKLAIGCLGLALAYGLLALAAWSAADGRVSWLWLLVFFVVLTVAELYFSPIGLSLVSRIAPERSRSFLMGVWMTTTFVGNLFAGWLGSFWLRLGSPAFFTLVAGLCALACALILAARGPLLRLMPEETRA